MKAILKANNKVLTTAGKIFQVGESSGPKGDFFANTLTAPDGSSISVWPDISGHGINAQQTVAVYQPTIQTFDSARRGVHFAGNMSILFSGMKLTARIRTRSAFFLFLPVAGSGAEHSSNASIAYDSIDTVAGSAFWGSSTLYYQKSRNTVANDPYTKAYINRGSEIKPEFINRANGTWIGIWVDVADLIRYVNTFNYEFSAYINRIVLFDYRPTDLNRKAFTEKYLTEAGL